MAGEKPEGLMELEQHIKKQARKADKLHLHLESKIIGRHVELWVPNIFKTNSVINIKVWYRFLTCACFNDYMYETIFINGMPVF